MDYSQIFFSPIRILCAIFITFPQFLVFIYLFFPEDPVLPIVHFAQIQPQLLLKETLYVSFTTNNSNKF